MTGKATFFVNSAALNNLETTYAILILLWLSRITTTTTTTTGANIIVGKTNTYNNYVVDQTQTATSERISRSSPEFNCTQYLPKSVEWIDCLYKFQASVTSLQKAFGEFRRKQEISNNRTIDASKVVIPMTSTFILGYGIESYGLNTSTQLNGGEIETKANIGKPIRNVTRVDSESRQEIKWNFSYLQADGDGEDVPKWIRIMPPRGVSLSSITSSIDQQVLTITSPLKTDYEIVPTSRSKTKTAL